MMNDPGSSDESQIRVVFSGWESELSDLSIPVSNADGLNAVQPGGQGKHGGFRRGSGRKAQVYRQFMDADLHLQSDRDMVVPLDELRKQQASHARAAKSQKQVSNQSASKESSKEGSVWSKSMPHADARSQSLLSMTALQKFLLLTAENVRSLNKSSCHDSTVGSVLIEKQPIVSFEAAAARHEEARSSLRRKTQQTACALINSAGVHLAGLINWFHTCQANGTHRLVLVVKLRRYDETPTRIAVKVASQCHSQSHADLFPFEFFIVR